MVEESMLFCWTRASFVDFVQIGYQWTANTDIPNTRGGRIPRTNTLFTLALIFNCWTLISQVSGTCHVLTGITSSSTYILDVTDPVLRSEQLHDCCVMLCPQSPSENVQKTSLSDISCQCANSGHAVPFTQKLMQRMKSLVYVVVSSIPWEEMMKS